MQREAIVIKKYPNRRLYDTASGRYVNLADLAALIREGGDVQVVDAKSGEDVTRIVLTQIIAEDAKDHPAGLPLELLRQLIIASDRAGQEFVMWYLRSAFEAYEKVQGAVQSRLSDVRSAAMSPLGVMRSLFSGPSAAREEEVEELRRRVAELEETLRATAAPRKRRDPPIKRAGNK
jgi:polyhydroxyalkanoate synthesis repressor PhaR